jgi:hypothetical protein
MFPETSVSTYKSTRRYNRFDQHRHFQPGIQYFRMFYLRINTDRLSKLLCLLFNYLYHMNDITLLPVCSTSLSNNSPTA